MTAPPWEIRQGHVLDVLRATEPESVQVCVTSPPYWGLRAYKTEPQVWGGDPDCAHEWGDETRRVWADAPGGPKQASNPGANYVHSKDASCARCGAWRGELGSEPTIECYVEHIVTVFREVRRVLRSDGTLWLNIGDSYAGSGKGPSTSLQGLASSPSLGQRIGSVNGESGHTSGVKPPPGLKAKDLCLIPERLALALQADGWWVRSRIAWCKRAPMPESVTDRPTSAWEHVWLLSKSARYYWDQEAVRESTEDSDTHSRGPEYHPMPKTLEAGNGFHNNESWAAATWGPVAARNLRNFWLLSPEPFPEAHFATFPTEIPRRAILAGSSERGCCPQCGAPWRRVTKPSNEYAERLAHANDRGDWYPRQQTTDARPDGTKHGKQEGGIVRDVETLGWEPTCACPPAIPATELAPAVPFTPVPCTVLDPFAGSGTTVMVALRHNRRAVGIELNPDYVRMARGRIVGDAPLFNGDEP